MAKFLTTTHIVAEIESIINSAKNTLILICPFVRIPETILQNLKVADQRKVKIILVYGKRELDVSERHRLGQLRNLSLRYIDNLHAKCFFNEQTLVVTSFNMYDASVDNREMGILVTLQDDPACFKDAREEARRIISLATKDEIRNVAQAQLRADSPQPGYCIRCRSPIELDLEPPFRPFCYDCFMAWTDWGNTQYEERFCHLCGKLAITTINKPFCSSCYRNVTNR